MFVTGKRDPLTRKMWCADKAADFLVNLCFQARGAKSQVEPTITEESTWKLKANVTGTHQARKVVVSDPSELLLVVQSSVTQIGPRNKNSSTISQ